MQKTYVGGKLQSVKEPKNVTKFLQILNNFLKFYVNEEIKI